jgi:segregation and condensation protein B
MVGQQSSASQPEAEVSLERLSAAFAEVLGRQRGGGGARRAGTESLPQPPAPDATQGGDVSPRSILEAMLFVGLPDGQPLRAEQAAAVMRGVTPEEVHALVRELNDAYRARGCPYEIATRDAGYRMVLRPQWRGLRERFLRRVREARLSQAAIDILALVAYKQPITRDEINRLRDKDSGPILLQLVRRRLLQIERDAQQPRVVRYRTTRRFLNILGLETLADLPQRDDLDRR